MEITQSQLLRVSVIEWGRFASRDMEERFRTENLAADSKTAKFLALMYGLTAVVFPLLDWALKGVTPTLLILFIPRSVMVVSTIALLLRLRYAITPSRFDHWLLGWISVNFLMELWVNSTSSAPQTALSSLLWVWALSLVVPVRFSYQAWSATAVALAFTGLIIGQKPEPALLAAILIASVLALAIGLVCSRRSHRTRRESFAAHLVERETGVLLEMALAQIKTLEGILPICSACKKIRREDESWVGLDEYVSEKTTTRFSHGMCPDCITRFYPDYSPQRRRS